MCFQTPRCVVIPPAIAGVIIPYTTGTVVKLFDKILKTSMG